MNFKILNLQLMLESVQDCTPDRKQTNKQTHDSYTKVEEIKKALCINNHLGQVWHLERAVYF